jgi:hypothetical protein
MKLADNLDLNAIVYQLEKPELIEYVWKPKESHKTILLETDHD